MDTLDWQEQAKWFLKSELIRRGISNEELVYLLKNIGVEETKTSIDSKISRGTFSAYFLFQCLNAIGCDSFNPKIPTVNIAAEPESIYIKREKKKHHSNDH